MSSKIFLNNIIFNKNPQNSRHFWKFLKIIFNSVDKHRLKLVGPDRLCAEWLLKNGASVKWKDAAQYVINYNTLPDEKELHFIEKVDATDSAIHHIGFPHFSGCKYINELKLVKCSYIENEAISLLHLLKESLINLEIVECKNITDEGLKNLKDLNKLKYLKLGGMPYVENPDNVLSELKSALPECKIIYESRS